MAEVSVIVPVYNVEKYLNKCLDSVLAQTFGDWECIAVDDGSNDASGRILDEYARKDVRIKVVHQENAGVIAARNRAIAMASGEFIFPLDGDDYLEAGALQNCVEYMKNYDVDVVYGQTVFEGAKTGLFELAEVSKEIMVKHNVVVCSAMYRKSDWEKYGGYDENLKLGLEDWEFWLNFVEDDKKFHRLDDICLHYVIKDVSRNTKAKKFFKPIKCYIRKKHKKLFAKYEKSLKNKVLNWLGWRK